MTSDFINSIEWQHSPHPIAYQEAIDKMESRAAALARGQASELIWFLEHPHVYTAGSSAKKSDVLEARCPIIETGRGGQVTYHGPGQRVIYLVMDLNQRGQDIRAYVQALEEWVIQTLQSFEINCYRREGRIGLWVPRTDSRDDKIAAIGVRVKKWIAFHGVAINLNPDLTFYQGIVPCGIRDHGVTSLHALGKAISMHDLDHALQETFPKVFA